MIKGIAAAAASILVIGGCMETASESRVDPKVVQAYLADKPAGTHKLFSRVATEGERNRVLRAGEGAQPGGGASQCGTQPAGAR